MQLFVTAPTLWLYNQSLLYVIWISLSAGSGSSWSSSLFSGLFITNEADRAGNKGSGGITMVDVHTLLETFLNMSLRFA